MIGYWLGDAVDETMPKEKLLEIIKYLAEELVAVSKDRRKWMRHGDAAAYLLDRSE